MRNPLVPVDLDLGWTLPNRQHLTQLLILDTESGHPRLNSTVLDSDLVFDGHDLVNTRNNVTHQSHPVISDETGGFIESPIGIGTSTRLQTRRSQLIVKKNFLFQVNWTPLKERFLTGKI